MYEVASVEAAAGGRDAAMIVVAPQSTGRP